MRWIEDDHEDNEDKDDEKDVDVNEDGDEDQDEDEDDEQEEDDEEGSDEDGNEETQMMRMEMKITMVAGKKLHGGLQAILPTKCKKEPLKIAIDCNVKACSMLQI